MSSADVGRYLSGEDLPSLVQAATDCIEDLVRAVPAPAGFTLELMAVDRGNWVTVTTSGLTSRARVHDLARKAAARCALRVAVAPHERPLVLQEAAADALQSWLRSRPVTNDEAAADGICVLSRDAAFNPVWRVAVLRETEPVLWTPLNGAADVDLKQVQAGAMERSLHLRGTLEIHGPAAVFMLPNAPAASTALLANPERLLDLAKQEGLDLADAWVVADEDAHAVVFGSAAATRRIAAGLPVAPCVMQWRDLDAIRWWL